MLRQRSILDEKDIVILRTLAENARVSYTELAKKLGISDVAVIKRIKRLEQMGVIRRYTIVVDPKALGYTIVSYTGVDVEPERLLQVVEELKRKDYVKELAITSGDHSIMAIIWARDSSELTRIHEEIQRIPGVRRVCPAIILEKVKEADILG